MKKILPQDLLHCHLHDGDSQPDLVGHPLQAHGLDPEELEPPSHHSSSNPSCHPLQAHGLDPEELEPPAHHSSSGPSCNQLEPHHLDPGSQVQVILNGPCWLSAAMPPKHLAQGDSRSHAGQCPDHGSSEGSRCAPAIAWYGRSAASSIHTLVRELFQMQCRYEAGVRLVQGQSLHLWHDLVVAAEQGGS